MPEQVPQAPGSLSLWDVITSMADTAGTTATSSLGVAKDMITGNSFEQAMDKQNLLLEELKKRNAAQGTGPRPRTLF